MSDYLINRYVRTSQPSDAESLPTFLATELQKIQRALNTIIEGLPEVSFVAPDQPREGTLAYAKAPWNPGSGDGLYVYKSGGWTFIA